MKLKKKDYDYVKSMKVEKGEKPKSKTIRLKKKVKDLRLESERSKTDMMAKEAMKLYKEKQMLKKEKELQKKILRLK